MKDNARLVHRIQVPLRWGDMDANGHANNTLYFRFFEEARIQWLQSQNFSADGSGQGPTIITTGATFLKELRYPATLEVKTYTGTAGRSSLETFHAIVDSDTNTVHCEGYAKIVWFDHDTQSPIPLPEPLRQLAADSR